MLKNYNTALKVCAIVPLYNEEKYAGITIAALQKIKSITKIIVIDDGSKDNTKYIIKKFNNILIITHYKNKGKGESIKDGIMLYNADIYIFVDGDLGESAQKIEILIDEVANNCCDVCIAMLPDNKGTGGIGFLRMFSKLVVKVMTNTDFPCPLSGVRVLKKEVVQDSNVKVYPRYGIEVGMLIDIINMGYDIKVKSIDISHRFTGRNLSGYLHRLRQFKDIASVFLYKLLR